MAEQQPPEGHEGAPKAHDGAENGNGKSIAQQADQPPVPEVSPTPLGNEKQMPIPSLSGGRRKPPVKARIIITAAAAPARGQVSIEGEQLLISRVRYFKATTTPRFDGEGRVESFDYDQTFKPTWTEGLQDFLDANGLKLVRQEEEGDEVDPGDIVDIERLRAPVTEEAIPS
jgi:hypothetical protein